MMPTLNEAIRQRYACRDFDAGRPPTAEQLRLLLEAGRLAPSSFGLEPWRFIAVTGVARRGAVARACFDQPAAQTAPALVVIIALVAALDPAADYVRDRLAAEARGQDPAPIHAAYRAFHHPDSIGAWAVGQCNFAAAHMLLQAAHMGLGSCPIGGFDEVALAAALDLPPGETPALVIAAGPCRHAAPERVRKPLG
ncbi:NAD(P)H-dependent oxidoreductase [Thiobacillus sedimenti]|uniref:NAD(P)H-dependent oxidoreductase n=1 Tax=Thiobacillus sedimenti TaxID=3110231 RepID=A0ABZ1CEX4_9PROT|nr:NAD(P)H-dependent oxidoreductase [Thiobacillus sp. SCUT-2]WRS37918.1 NAD(P)H-dependent oxidoreductase [Thiobacillus sp. SCUT-2]